MRRANPLWGAPRIHGELLKLGLTVSQATVSKYMLRPRRPPSQTWRAFLKNHAADLIALARRDSVLGAEGAVLFLERVSPALQNVDGSSGAIGHAVNHMYRFALDTTPNRHDHPRG
jgi:hypothetical protein